MDTSYLASQVTTIIGQLHGLFDEIGVPSHERDSREAELFSALSETLHNQLKLVTSEKHAMTEEAHRLITTIKQMEVSLEDPKDYHNHYDDLQVSYPLIRCLKGLKEKYNHVSKQHRERFESVRKLVQALESYASHLEPSFIQIKLPPTTPDATIPPNFDISPSYIASLDKEFTRVYAEYTRRLSVVKATAEEVIKLWAELGTPQAQTDSRIVEYSRDAPEQLGLHKDDLARLSARRDKLVEEKRGRERRLKELRITIEDLWDRLGVEEQERKMFLASNRGCGLRAINEFEDELSRLNELKRQNLHLFVEDARCKLQELWDGLYFSEEEMLEFTPAFSDVYSDALLSAHEAEIARLEALKEQRAPTLQLIDKHRSLIKDRDDLAASSQDASRLMARGQKGEKRDPTRLLREEKMRKRIAKELPKVEAELKQTLEQWEDEYGRPFLVHGSRYLDELAASAAKPAPPRSKTPSVAPPPQKPAKSAPPAQKGGTVRGAPPARSKTPTAMGTLRGNPLSSSVMSSSVMSSSVTAASTTTGLRSPSKIPARAPLTNMPHGSNSPERRYAAPQPQGHGRENENTIRKMGPPRVPPPKMKDLFVPPTPTPSRDDCDADAQRSASIVRHVAPEDVYDDRDRDRAGSRLGAQSVASYTNPYPPSLVRNNSTYSQHSQYGQHPNNPPVPVSYSTATSTYSTTSTHSHPPSRQISTTSSHAPSTTSSSHVSGSENWETYDDASDGEVEPEPDASEAYYAKLRAARGKRWTPDGGYASPRNGVGGKRVKGLVGQGGGLRGVEEEYVEGGGQLVRVQGGEEGWTDEDV